MIWSLQIVPGLDFGALIGLIANPRTEIKSQFEVKADKATGPTLGAIPSSPTLEPWKVPPAEVWRNICESTVCGSAINVGRERHL